MWQQIQSLLLEARRCLPDRRVTSTPALGDSTGRLQGTVQEFEMFLQHNEFELAWDTLADVGRRTGARPAFWRALARAAELMGLTTKAALARGLGRE